MKTPHTIEIHIEGGVVHDVRNIPRNTVVRIIDYDIEGVEPERITKLSDGSHLNGQEVVSEHWSNDLLVVTPCPKQNPSPVPAAEKT